MVMGQSEQHSDCSSFCFCPIVLELGSKFLNVFYRTGDREFEFLLEEIVSC